jgi:hypothetical protein
MNQNVWVTAKQSRLTFINVSHYNFGTFVREHPSGLCTDPLARSSDDDSLIGEHTLRVVQVSAKLRKAVLWTSHVMGLVSKQWGYSPSWRKASRPDETMLAHNLLATPLPNAQCGDVAWWMRIAMSYKQSYG